MTHREHDVRTLLNRYLKRHGDPSREEMAAAVEHVWQKLEPDVRRAPIGLSLGATPRSVWRPSVAAVAAAIAVVLGSAALVRQWTQGISPNAIRVLEIGETVRTTAEAGAMLALADGSRVEMRAQSELSLERADDGARIRLRTGGIIVNAAKQPNGHLYVQTKDMTVAVIGTVFLVNAEETGSRVAVIEGEVRVQEAKTETKLRTGEQVSTNPALESRPVGEEIAWSLQADVHRALLQSASVKATADESAAQVAAPRPQFEEASIRQCDPDNLPQVPAGGRGGGANSLVMTPGRFHVSCMTVATLVRTAYGYGPMALEVMNVVEDGAQRGGPEANMRFDAVYGLGVEDGRRVRGGPDWVRSDKYSIEAIADASSTTQAMKGPMLQDLLERRLQVKVHIEAEQVPAFALTVANGGFKLKPMEEGACTREPLSDAIKAQRDRAGFAGPVMITEAARLGIKPTCGTFYGERNGPNIRWEHVAQSPGSVARAVAFALEARVVDRTGITGKYIFGWEYGPDESTPGNAREMATEKTWVPRPGWDGPMTLPKAPSIFTVLEQELGLKVDPIRVPREFIVIDRVERPSPN